jgi:hypothetical protein
MPELDDRGACADRERRGGVRPPGSRRATRCRRRRGSKLQPAAESVDAVREAAEPGARTPRQGRSRRRRRRRPRRAAAQAPTRPDDRDCRFPSMRRSASPSDRDSSNVPAALLGIWPARKPGPRRARPGQSSFAARFGDRRGSRCDAGSVHTTQQDACIREAARARAALIGALAMDDEHERRVRLLLLSEGAVLAHWFQRPLAAGMDDDQK